MILRAFMVGLFSVIALGQNAADPEIARASRSPYDLERYVYTHPRIDNWRPLLTPMGGTAALFRDLPPCSLDAGEPSCRAELIVVPSPSQVILLLKTSGRDYYLRYRQQTGSWRFGGHLRG